MTRSYPNWRRKVLSPSFINNRSTTLNLQYWISNFVFFVGFVVTNPHQSCQLPLKKMMSPFRRLCRSYSIPKDLISLRKYLVSSSSSLAAAARFPCVFVSAF
jgi:hypothetical protein